MWLLLCDDERHADKLSRDLMHMWRGRDNTPTEKTIHFFSIRKHPVTGQIALTIPSDFSRPISKRFNSVDDMRTVELSRVADTDTKMRSELQKGSVGTTTILAMSAGNRIITEAKAKADGWFPDPPTIDSVRGRG